MNKTGWLVALGVAILVIIIFGVSLFADYGTARGYRWGMMGPGMMGPGLMGGFGYPFFGGIVMLIFGVLVVGGCMWLVQLLASSGGGTGMRSPLETPLDILKARYARGEITREQFESIRSDLNG